MLIETDLSRLDLKTRELVRLHDAAGMTIACDSGSVWVTRNGDLRDVVLSAGERTEIAGSALVVIQAFEPSHLAIGPAVAPAPVARRSDANRSGGNAPKRAAVGDYGLTPA